MANKKVYLAGPDVFRPNAKEHGEYLRKVANDIALSAHFPLDAKITLTGKRHEDGLRIYQANKDLIDECDGVVANLNPFRGPSADVGTVWEIGYAAGRGKPVVGYSMEWATHYRDRVISMGIPHDGMLLEDFIMTDNLMIVGGCSSIEPTYWDALRVIKRLLDE